MEPSKKYSDNRVDTSGSEKSPVAIGHHINQNIYPEPKPIRVRPNPGEESLIWIGRKIMLALFGTLVHDMKGYALGTSGLTGLGLLIGYYSVYRNPFPSGSQPALYTELAGLIVVILAVYLGPLLFLTSRETQCPHCGARFSYTMTDKVVMNVRRLPGKVVMNSDNTYTCSECKHTETKTQQVEEVETAPPADDEEQDIEDEEV